MTETRSDVKAEVDTGRRSLLNWLLGGGLLSDDRGQLSNEGLLNGHRDPR